ncbi:MAG: phosphoribosylformylglycinamidine synthase subunit PurS, partial [Spirochaetota bacterium]
MARLRNTYRFEIRDRSGGDPRSRALPAKARALGLDMVKEARRAKLFFVHGTIAPEELDLLGRFLFSDSVVESFSWKRIDTESVLDRPTLGLAGFSVIEVAPRPGVTDTVAAEIVRAARELGISGLDSASTGTRWEIRGDGFDETTLDLLARRLFANALVERWALGEIQPSFIGTGEDQAGSKIPHPETFAVGEMS